MESQPAPAQSDTDDSASTLSWALHELESKATLNWEYDVPYLGGMSLDGLTVYIDRSVPRQIIIAGTPCDLGIFLSCHEQLEYALIRQVGLKYQAAHQIAQRFERAAVSDTGIPYGPYDSYLHQLEAVCYAKVADPHITLPPDLDPTPYRDEEDHAVLALLTKSRK